MPFAAAHQPNLGLSLLRQAALNADFSGRIRYANLEFAKEIGIDLYRKIAGRLPADLLFGDLIFSGCLQDKPLDYRAAIARLGLDDPSRDTHLPPWAIDSLPDLQRRAALLIERQAREIASDNTTVVGFNLMFHVTPSLALAKRIKEIAPEKLIAVGGANCEGEMGRALHQAYPFIDFVCRGEGERLIVDLLQSLSTGAPKIAKVQGLVWRNEKGESIGNGERTELVRDMDSLPTPQFDDWFEQAQAHLPAILPRATLPYETSRGCWWGEKQHCIFCGLNGESMVSRAKSPGKVLQELGAYRQYPARRILATDLILPHQYFRTLLPEMAREKLGFDLFFEIKANLTYQQLVLLRDAGVRSLQPGIESLSSAVLKLMRKGVSAYQNIRLLKWAAELGLRIYWNLLYGFPGECPGEYDRMAEIIPSLVHLQPPLDGCFRVRLDRFSPLFFDRARLGIANCRPAPAYGLVHQVDPETLSRLAYHFEYDLPGEHPSLDYVNPLKEAVYRWHCRQGKASFTGEDTGDRIRLRDSRFSESPACAELAGLEREVFLACDEGHTLSAIASRLGREEREIAGVLEEFVGRRWVLFIDDRYLGLAIAPKTAPEAAP
ncbi:MAG TPA: RiPP maturation radical SAM C-methyltransferase [Capsulimonadaceae bacterium]|nr:RiPP maturation radical SAM C-methyltransferase [Capsulimonadaceae bacterium]